MRGGGGGTPFLLPSRPLGKEAKPQAEDKQRGLFSLAPNSPLPRRGEGSLFRPIARLFLLRITGREGRKILPLDHFLFTEDLLFLRGEPQPLLAFHLAQVLDVDVPHFARLRFR